MNNMLGFQLKIKNEKKETVKINQEVYSQEQSGDSPPAFEFQRTRGINQQALQAILKTSRY